MNDGSGKLTVIVHPDYCNNKTKTDGSYVRNLFTIVLEAVKSQVKVKTDLVSRENLLGSKMLTSCAISWWMGQANFLEIGLFYKGTNLIYKG